MTNDIKKVGISYRNAGWTAIMSGLFGLLAHSALMTAVITRSDIHISEHGLFLFRTHDALAILQFLLMIPLLRALYDLSNKQPPGISRVNMISGIIVITLTALFLLLIFPWIMSDMYYMIPQGMFGVWLIVANGKLTNVLTRGITTFGIIIGIGLLLVGLFEIAYAIIVSPIGLRIPAVPIEELEIPVETTANIFLHMILDIGSLVGVLMLPIWTIIVGRKLIREK